MTVGTGGSQLGRVRGLGSARHGGEHWIAYRVGSIALLLLGLWLLASLLMLPDLQRPTIVEWLSSPLAAVPMALFVVTAFHHGLHGLYEVVDDYVHDAGGNFALRTLLLFVAVAGAGAALFALAGIAFGGVA